MRSLKTIRKRHRLFLIAGLMGTFMFCSPRGDKNSEISFRYKIIDADSTIAGTYVGHAEINNDGKPDILAFKGDEEGYLSWYEYPNFERHFIQLAGGKGQFHNGRPTAADIDNDRDMDVFVIRARIKAYWYENPLPNRNPKANWNEHYLGLYEGRVKDYGFGDFDGDGKLDLVFMGYDSTSIFFQNNKDSWIKKSFSYENGHEGADVGDIDREGWFSCRIMSFKTTGKHIQIAIVVYITNT